MGYKYKLQRGGGSLFISDDLNWFQRFWYRIKCYKVIKLPDAPPTFQEESDFYEYYRTHPDEFVEKYLHVDLKPYQRILLKLLWSK